MKKRLLLAVTALLTGLIIAFQPSCSDDSGGNDDTETGDTGLTSDTSNNTVTSSDADTGGDTSADTASVEGNGACSCMTQAACAAGVNEIDFSYACTAVGNVCCKNAAATTDTSSVGDTSTQSADTTSNNDSGTPVDTAVNWWDDSDNLDDSDGVTDTGTSGWNDSDNTVDTGTSWWDNDSEDTAPVDTAVDTADNGDCPYSCITRQECWQQDGERMRDFECGEGVCCDLGTEPDSVDVTDTEDEVDTDEVDTDEVDTDEVDTEEIDCQFDCVNRFQCNDPGEYEVEDQVCDGNDICCATEFDTEEDTSGPEDTETIAPTSECDAQGLYCVSETQCTVAQARDEFDCDVAGTVCCEL